MAELSVAPSAVALPDKGTETAATVSTPAPVAPKPKGENVLSMYVDARGSGSGIGVSIDERSDHFKVSLSVDSGRFSDDNRLRGNDLLKSQTMLGFGVAVSPTSMFIGKGREGLEYVFPSLGVRVMGDLTATNPSPYLVGELDLRTPQLASAVACFGAISYGSTIKGDTFAMLKLGLEIMLPGM